MRLTRAYASLVRLYPTDYRVRFGDEMRTAFDEAARARALECGVLPLIQFVVAELIGLAIGVPAEWIAKLTSDPAARGRHFPDCRRMRPVGITRDEWAAALDRFPPVERSVADVREHAA